MKQNILIIGDDIRCTSGVANQLKHVCKELYKKYNVIHIGVLPGTKLTNKSIHTFDTGEQITIYPSIRYDDMSLIVRLIKDESISCIALMTDPYRFMTIWNNAKVINAKVPIYYISVWDTYLIPEPEGKYHFNLPIYESCNGIGCISRQTEWFTNQIFKQEKHNTYPYIHYIGHGSDPEIYKPLNDNELEGFRNHIFQGRTFDFVCFQTSRNQSRKKFPDLIEAWKLFTNRLTKDQSDKCCLMLKTEPTAQFGTNLIELCSALCPNRNIYILGDSYPEKNMNMLYNIADVTCLCSNAEGFGLTINESMLAGTPIVATSTGGLQDQIGYFNKDTNQSVYFNGSDFINKCKNKEYYNGTWSYPIHPQRTIIGSPETPYLYDTNASIDDITDGIHYWYNMSKENRIQCGSQGRNYCLNQGLTSYQFAANVVSGIEKTIQLFKETNLYRIYKV